MSELLQIVDAAGTPILALLCAIVWRIKTNDLPHIRSEISALKERSKKR